MKKKPIPPKIDRDSITELYARASSNYQAGRLDVARSLLESIIRLQPRYVPALNFMAIIAAQTNRPGEAEGYFRTILSLTPNDPEVTSNLGNVLLALGRNEEAEAAYRKALSLRPEHPDAAYNLAGLLRRTGRRNEAEDYYRMAIKSRPSPAALTALALLLKDRSRLDEAEQAFLDALELNPNTVEALNGLALLRQQASRLEEAEALFRKALRISPSSLRVTSNLGGLLQQTQRWTEAEALLRAALRLQPDAWEVLANLGVTLHAQHRLKEAEDTFREVLRLKPDYTVAHNNLGLVLKERGQILEARRVFEQVLATDPSYGVDKGTYGELAEICMATCDWSPLSTLAPQLAHGMQERNMPVAPLTFMSLFDDPDLQRLCAAAYAERWRSARPALDPAIPRYQHQKIRVAYLSGDFREHAVAHLIRDLFAWHDRSRFEITAVSFGPDTKDPMREFFIESADRFIDVRSDADIAIARRLREMEIDIAVDLAGFTRYSRTGILAHRPAPVQVNYLGYPGTMGTPFIDYIIADRVIIPEVAQSAYCEKAVYLPDTFLATSCWEIAEHVPPRRDLGLPEEAFVFCCFNNCNKIQPAFFDLWMRLLGKVSGSVLWFSSYIPSAQVNLRREAQARGVDPERLIFAPKLPLPEHLARYRQADLFLDTLPRNATTTAADCLWAGLPVLTCIGNTYHARACASLLYAVGVPELVAPNPDDYEAEALRLATHPAELAALRTKLMNNRTTYPLFDSRRFRQHIELAYVRMWEIWQRGEAPQSFAIDAVDTLEEVVVRNSL